MFRAATEVFTLAEVDSMFDNLPFVEPLNVFSKFTELPIVPLPTDADNALIDAETDALKLLMLPVKSGISLAPSPNKYKVELPLA